MRRFAAILVALFAVGIARTQEASKLEFKGKTEIVKVERIVRVWDDRLSLKEFPFTLQAPVGAIRPSWTVPAGVTWTRKGRLIEITAAPKGELKISADWAILNKTTLDITEDFDTFTLLIGGEIPPPPKPPEPPTPEPKPPIPVTSFRVILVYESADTLTSAQKAVIYGKAVEDFLNATCTGGKAGWRRRDKDMPGELDPAMAAVWTAVKPEFAPPKNTKTPAVAVQVNDKIEIIEVAATPAAMVATLKKYAEGK